MGTLQDQQQVNAFSGQYHNSGGTSYFGSSVKVFQIHAKEPTIDVQECLRLIKNTDPRIDRYDILLGKDVLLSETCQWIFADPAFHGWWETHSAADDAPSPSLLWLHGDAGKGKTMLMNAIIDELKDKLAGERYRVIYFFCRNEDDRTNSAVSVARGLLYLLLDERPDLVKHIQRRLFEGGENLFRSDRAFLNVWSMLRTVVADASLGPLYFLIDALDECNHEQQELLDALTRPDLSLPKNVRWLVSSRNDIQIREHLEADQGTLHTSLEVNSQRVSQAVNRFIEVKVSELERKKKLKPEVTRLVKSHLMDNAEGTFLWVSMACKALDKARLRHLSKTLQDLPNGLIPLYDRMLKQIDQQDDSGDCAAILRAVSTASRPLTLQEIWFVAGLDQKLYEEQLDTTRELIDDCGSFLTIRDDVVHFVHQSVRDFFYTGAGRSIFPDGERVFMAEAAERCLTWMKRDLCVNMCRLDSPGALVRDVDDSRRNRYIKPALAYACVFWFYHFQAGAPQGDLNDSKLTEYLDSFLSETLLLWLECLSLLRRMQLVTETLRQLENMLETNGLVAKLLLDKVNDARRFVTAYGSIVAAAPLQIYVSALAFAPLKSLTRSQFRAYTPAWIHIEGHRQTNESWISTSLAIQGNSSYFDAVNFSPDGLLLAAESRDAVYVWDVSTGIMRHNLEKPTSSRRGLVCFSPNSTLFAYFQETVYIWSTKSGSLLQQHETQSAYISQAFFSQDSRHLICTYRNGSFSIWDIDAEKVLEQPSILTFMSLSLQTDLEWNSHSIMGSMTLRVMPSINSLIRFSEHIEPVRSVSFSAKNKLIVSRSSDRIVVLNSETSECLFKIDDAASRFSIARLANNGQMLASGDESRHVKIWTIADGTLLHDFKGPGDTIRGLLFSQDDTLVGASSHQSMWVWNIATEEALCVIDLIERSSVTSLAFSPDSKRFAFGTEGSAARADTVLLPFFERKSGKINAIALSPDESMIAIAAAESTIKVLNFSDRSSLHTFQHKYPVEVSHLIFSSDNERLASVCWPRPGSDLRAVINVWNLKQGTMIKRHIFGRATRYSDFCVSSDCCFLAYTTAQKLVIWSAISGLVTASSYNPFVEGGKFTFSPDGKVLLQTGLGYVEDYEHLCYGLVARNTANGNVLYSRAITSSTLSPILETSFSSDGEHVLIWFDIGLVRIMDASSGRRLHEVQIYQGFRQKASLRLLPGGKELVVDTAAGVERTFDTQTGGVLSKREITPLNVSPDLSWITCGGKRILWLPYASFRSKAHIIRKGLIVIGTNDGHVVSLLFDTDSDFSVKASHKEAT